MKGTVLSFKKVFKIKFRKIIYLFHIYSVFRNLLVDEIEKYLIYKITLSFEIHGQSTIVYLLLKAFS